MQIPPAGTQSEERKPLKGTREKGSPEPENHYSQQKGCACSTPPSLTIRAFLFSWVREIWNPWEKLLGVFKARCLLLNQALCLDERSTAFCAVLGVKGKAAEVTWPKPSPMRQSERPLIFVDTDRTWEQSCRSLQQIRWSWGGTAYSNAFF